jgi:photosystem II stability/assembly factor-like uncharacterized protein
VVTGGVVLGYSSRRLRYGVILLVALGCVTRPGFADSQRQSVGPQQSGLSSLLQAVSAVDDRIAWVSGHRASYARTTDGGVTWRPGVVPGPDTLQFRDVHAVSADTAYLLASGPSDMSRVYKTTDGGASWALQFVNDVPGAFFDCFDFWDANSGVAFSDAVDGRIIVIATSDGETWRRVPSSGVPRAAGSEGGFAASGTCLVARGDSVAWIGSGAGDAARVYRTADRGMTWSVVPTPVVGGSSTSGITSLVLLDGGRAMALGGDINAPETFTDNVAVTGDGGERWRLASHPSFSGAVYGASAVPGLAGAVVAVGPKGVSLTRDWGASWVSLDTLSHWAVQMVNQTTGWAVGPDGRVSRITLH